MKIFLSKQKYKKIGTQQDNKTTCILEKLKKQEMDKQHVEN